MTSFLLRIYTAEGRLEDTLTGYTQEGAEEHAAWEITQHGTARVEIVREDDGTVVKTVTAEAPGV